MHAALPAAPSGGALPPGDGPWEESDQRHEVNGQGQDEPGFLGRVLYQPLHSTTANQKLSTEVDRARAIRAHSMDTLASRRTTRTLPSATSTAEVPWTGRSPSSTVSPLQASSSQRGGTR